LRTVGYHEDDEEQYRIVEGVSKLLEPESVLEIGCGYQRFRELFDSYTGIDNDPAKNPDYVMDINQLDFADQSFDMVLSCTVLMHNKDVAKALKEIARVARRYIVLIESYRWIGKARPHRYEFEGFEKCLELNLTTTLSPLRVWIFKRR